MPTPAPGPNAPLDTMECAVPATETGRKPVARWAVHRRLYDWVLSLADRPYGTWALAIISFAESSFFPIPPDVLLLPLCLSRRGKAWFYASVCTLASVAGGALGWFIGHAFWDATQSFWFNVVPGFTPEKFEQVKGLFTDYGLLIVFAAAFTPIPYKVFTITAGVMNFAFLPFLAASLIGRGARFFLEAAMMFAFGKQILPLIDRYFNLVCIAFTLLLIGGFVAIKLLH